MTHPRDMRRTVSFAAVALFALMLIVVALQDSSIAAAAAHEAPALRTLGTVVSRLGLSGYMLGTSAATALVAAVRLRRAERPELRARCRLLVERALFVFAAVAVSGLACQAIKHLVGRARPRFAEAWGAFHFDGPSFRSGIDSFPSGHATSVFAAAMALGLILPAWRVPLFAVAVLVCAARVLAGAHYPSDTVAGAFLGGVATIRLARAFAARDLAFPPIPDGQPHRRPPHVADERAAS